MPNVALKADNEGDAETDLEEEQAWLRAVASNEVFAYLAEPAEDIYSAEDGEPFRDGDGA